MSADASEEPRFAAPWEASAFAMRIHLAETGALDPAAFSKFLGEEMERAHDPADGTAYFAAFVRALERAVSHIASEDALRSEAQVWRRAAQNTPHGAPIEREAGLCGALNTPRSERT